MCPYDKCGWRSPHPQGLWLCTVACRGRCCVIWLGCYRIITSVFWLYRWFDTGCVGENLLIDLLSSSSGRRSKLTRANYLAPLCIVNFSPGRAGLTVGPAGGGVDDLPAEMASIARSIAASRFSRSTRERDLQQELGPEGTSAPQEALNERAVKVIRCVRLHALS